MNFTFNFNSIDLLRLFNEDKITREEIIYVFNNSTRLFEEGGRNISEAIFIQIGYTLKKRILLIAFTFLADNIDFIGAKVADENEIDSFYCGKK
jgi:uncharacterized DUF497 family protein